MLLDHILKRVICVSSVVFGSFTNTNVVEFSFPVIVRTLRCPSIGAVILIVRNIKLFGQGASEGISTLNTNIDDTLNILDIIFAKNITTFIWFTISNILAVCVLNNLGFTLYGLNKSRNWVSKSFIS